MPEPECGDREVEITLEACGVSFADLLMIAGRYQLRPEPPFVPGVQVAGRISRFERRRSASVDAAVRYQLLARGANQPQKQRGRHAGRTENHAHHHDLVARRDQRRGAGEDLTGHHAR